MLSLPHSALQAKELFCHYLQEYCHSKHGSGSVLDEAICYALAGEEAKRLRPLLVMLAAHAFSAIHAALPVALAVELVHTFSLIHDDLPCMDDDKIRRGKATLHVKFDEATALLAGDALLCDAFTLLASASTDTSLLPEQRLRCVQLLGEAVGSHGMIGGQHAEECMSTFDLVQLERMYRLKTGKLLGVACALGAVIAEQDEATVRKVLALGEEMGVAFQAIDDVTDGVADNVYCATSVTPEELVLRKNEVIVSMLAELRLSATPFASLIRRISARDSRDGE